jgi:type IV pilus assembly protein PilC
LGNSSFYLGFALLSAAVIMFLLWKTKVGKELLMRFFAWLPVTNALIRTKDGSYFCFAMALMLKSGLSFEQAMEYAQSLLIKSAKRKVSVFTQVPGDKLIALVKSGLLSAADARLLQMGARVGKMDAAMEDLAERNECKSEEAAERLVNIVEPVMVGLMGVCAGTVLLSVMLPLLGIMAAL